MKKSLLLLALLSSCSTLKKVGPARESTPILARGWSYIEPEKDFLRQDAGVAQISYSGAQISSTKLVFGSDRFGITALAKKTGQVLWQKRVKDGVSTLPLIYQTKLFAGTDSGELYCLDLNSGKVLWSVNLPAPSHGSMVISMDRLFVAAADESVHAFDPNTGKILWSYRRPAFAGTSIRGGGHPSIIAGRLWMGFSDGTLVSLDPQDGSVKSEKQFRDNLKFLDLDAKIIGWKDGLLVATYDGKLRYLNKDATLIWEFPAGSARAPITTDGDTIFYPSSDGYVYAIAGHNGKELWRYPLRRGVPTGMALLRKTLLVVGSEENTYALDTSSGKLLAEEGFGHGSGSYAPIVIDEESSNFYVLSNFSRVHQFHLNR